MHDGAVPFLSFRALDESGLFLNAFSTRLGGVSEGPLASMNLTYAKPGEKPEHVLENYRRISEAVGFSAERAVVSQQTHTTNVLQVSEKDFGKGVIRERDYDNIDGLVTNVPGLTLVTFYADCVPLYIADPVHRAIGLSHSGWRGTVNRMGKVTIEKMCRLYGSQPKDLICCIGPSICRDCFEVGAEVSEEFERAFGTARKNELIFGPHADGKYHVDLWRANELVFEDAGVPKAQIHTTNLCTRCNPNLLWSHRIFGEQRGNLAAFFSIREDA